MKLLLQQIDEEKDKSGDLESRLAEKTQKLQHVQERLVDVEASFRQQLVEAQSTIKELQESRTQIKQETMNQLSAKLQQSQSEFLVQKQTIEDLERRFKESQEQLLQATHEAKKQVAMRDQKIEFLDMQIKDVKEQLEESQRQHAQMVHALNQRNQNSDDESESTQTKLELLQKEFSAASELQIQQIKEIQSELANSKQALIKQESLSRQKLNEVECHLLDAQERLQDAESQRLTLQERVRVLDSAKSKLSDELRTLEQQFKIRMEHELTERDDHFKSELRDLQIRHDEQITQLKSFYDIEKEKVELRITEEKERSQRRLANFQEEQEARYREEVRDKDSEIEYLAQQLQELEQHQQSFSTQAEHEISLKQMQIEGLERQNADIKDRLNKLESTRNNVFDKQLEHFEQQRQELNQRIERLMADNLTKDKQIATITHQMERAAESLEKRSLELEAQSTQMDREKQVLIDRCEQAKMALNDMQDEAMHTKLESGREIALLNQQVEFLNKKIEDLQRTNEEGQRMFDDKLRLLRQEIQEDSQAQVDRVTQEKELWEQKYEQKRKALKDLEISLGKKISDLEKQTGLQHSALQKMELERQSKEHAMSDEIGRLQAQLLSADCNTSQGSLFGAVTTEELLQMKNQLSETERDLQDLQSTYDRDKALWEGKVQFLESQKDNYKRDLLESQRKFEITLDQLQKRGNQNKERQETSQQAILKVLESKYKQQIKELIENQQAAASEQKERAKKLESELANAQERLSANSKHKFDEVGSLEKRLQEAKANESRLQAAYQELQAESNRRIEEFSAQLMRDKEGFKTRLADAEKKAKEAEARRTQLLFSIEKERANWQLEEDHLKRKQIELEEFISNLEGQKETLKKENSKLRSDVRGNSAVGQKKQFVFAKGAQHLVSQTQAAMTSQAPLPKSQLITKTGSYTQQDQTSVDATTQNSSAGISQGSILNTAMNRLKENQNSSFNDLKQQSSSMEIKQRQMASPDITRMAQKSPLLVNRGSQNNFKPQMPPRQPLISGSLSSYNVHGPQDNMSNSGSAAGQGFKLNLPNRYSSQDQQNDDK